MSSPESVRLVVAGVAFVVGMGSFLFLSRRKPAGPRVPNAKERLLITSTWGSVRAMGLQEVGILFFKTLFEQQPGAIVLFNKFNKLDNVYESVPFKHHALTVLSTIDTAVSMLDDIENLAPVLKALGKAHLKYGVEPLHYDFIGTALLTTLDKGLGKAFTPEVEEAYTAMWGLVAATMKDRLYANES
jgi:hemoglobin-like flavoprotein